VYIEQHGKEQDILGTLFFWESGTAWVSSTETTYDGAKNNLQLTVSPPLSSSANDIKYSAIKQHKNSP